MPSQRQNQIRKAVWFVSVIIFVALCFAGLTSSKWLSGDGREVGLSKQCINGDCASIGISSLHWAWQFTLVACGMSVGLMMITAILIIVLLKYNRDRILSSAKCCCAIANVLLFVAMLIFPVGLEDDTYLPCDDGLESKSYHLCNPWNLDMGLYLMIVAMIFMCFAMCLSTLVTSKVSQRDVERMKRKRRETQGWYDPSRPRGARPSGEQSSSDDPASTTKSPALKLKPVVEDEPLDDNAGYLMIEGKGLQGWGEPEALGGGRGANLHVNEVYGEQDNNQSSYYNPYFNDDEEFM
jgi:hypothetical protein